MHGPLTRAVLLDFGNTLVERVSDAEVPLSRLELRPFPDSIPTLERLTQAGYLLAIVSNTTQSGEQEMATALRKIGMRQYFDALVTSFDVGHEKPDPAIFAHTLDRLRCSPAEAVMVGDDPAVDIPGAASHGLTTVLVCRGALGPIPAGVEPTFTVSSLLELPALLERRG